MMLVMVSVSGTAVASQSHVLGYLLIIKNFSLLQMRTEVDYAQTRLSIANVFNEFRQGRFVYLLASECLIERTFCCHKISTQGFGRSLDRKSTRLNSSHVRISYAVFCLKKK